MKLIGAIINNSKESRKENLLHVFEAEGKKSSSNFRYKFWEHENHPVLFDSTEMYNQRFKLFALEPCNSRLCSRAVALDI